MSKIRTFINSEDKLASCLARLFAAYNDLDFLKKQYVFSYDDFIELVIVKLKDFQKLPKSPGDRSTKLSEEEEANDEEKAFSEEYIYRRQQVGSDGEFSWKICGELWAFSMYRVCVNHLQKNFVILTFVGN